MLRSPTPVETIIVYDDEDGERERRTRMVKGIAARLTDRGAFVALPRVVGVGLRPECFRELERSDSAILIADLMSIVGSPTGARLLRAVGARAGVKDRTWRVALTKRAHPLVAEGLAGVAHALVVHDDADTMPLEEALFFALETSPATTETVKVYPEDISSRYDADLKRRLERAFGGRYTQAMADAAFRWITSPIGNMGTENDPRRDPRYKDLGELTHDPADCASSTPRPVTVTQLQKFLRARHGHYSTETLKRRLEAQLWTVSDAGVWAQITPEIVRLLTSPDVLVRLSEYRKTESETWLTQQEHAAARAFLEEAVEQGVHAIALTKEEGYRQINAVLARSADSQRLGQHTTQWDTCYAVLTLADWLFDRREDEATRRLGKEF